MENLFYFSGWKNIDAFDWHNGQLFRNAIEMACFGQDQAHTNGFNWIQTSESQNDDLVKANVNFGMDREFNIFVTM